MNRSAIGDDGSGGGNVLFSQYSDFNSQRAGKLEYGIYPVVDESNGQRKEQVYMRLERIKMNANYNQGSSKPTKSQLKFPGLEQYPNLNVLVNDQWHPMTLKNTNSVSSLGKRYAIPLKPKIDPEVFRDVSDDTDATGNPY